MSAIAPSINNNASFYQLEESLKTPSGLCGELFKGKDLRSTSPVIFKFAKKGYEKILASEIKCTKLFSDTCIPHSIQYRAHYPLKNRQVLVIDHIPAQDLFEYISKTPVSTQQALLITKQVLEFLAAIHQAGYLYGDMKLENLIYREDGSVSVVDMGGVHKSKEPLLAWTPGYMPAEVLLGMKPDESADIWALGSVLFTLIARESLIVSLGDSTFILRDIADRCDEFPLQFLEKTPRFSEFFQKVGDSYLWKEIFSRSLPPWPQVVHEVARKENWDPALETQVTALLGKMLAIENRPSSKTLLQDPIFQRDVSFKIIQNDSEAREGQLVISTPDGKEMPFALSASRHALSCLHLLHVSPDHTYTAQIRVGNQPAGKSQKVRIEQGTTLTIEKGKIVL